MKRKDRYQETEQADMNRDDQHQHSARASVEHYLRMDESEKDAEIQKAIARLQNRIHEILYMLESDKQHVSGMTSGEQQEQ